ncbi:DUF393 domain-containing protein [Aliiglaciecola sp. LCG003]|uniref:thiol-disulfide oxidoreductase DCC family protein n=1 Tax=Aliiglaciecola sp. LCG003 TaxID=3053655 RepID=UPI0033654AD7
MQFKLFYDGLCPLCMLEIRKLANLDHQLKIHFVDIQAEQFAHDYPSLDKVVLSNRIHAQLENGQFVTGLDANFEVWKRVGRGWIFAPLRWPLVRWFADRGYNFFAKHRHRISYLITGKKRALYCTPLTCAGVQSRDIPSTQSKIKVAPADE